MTPRILVFSGSTRAGSFNKRLAALGAEAIGAAGGAATLISLADFPMPIYDGDLEASVGIPAPAMALKRLFKQHHGFLIASPEENASVSALLKNAIDWVSRATPDEGGKVPYRGKVAALMAATPAALGGVRGLAHLRQILTTLGTWVVPDQLGLAGAMAAFSEEGRLRASAQQTALEALVAGLIASAGRIGIADDATSAT